MRDEDTSALREIFQYFSLAEKPLDQWDIATNWRPFKIKDKNTHGLTNMSYAGDNWWCPWKILVPCRNWSICTLNLEGLWYDCCWRFNYSQIERLIRVCKQQLVFAQSILEGYKLCSITVSPNFSCSGQLKRWHWHWLIESDFWFQRLQRALQSCRRSMWPFWRRLIHWERFNDFVTAPDKMRNWNHVIEG